MNKQQLEAEFTTLDGSLNTLLEAIRPSGECVLCNAARGSQHAITCGVWPFVWSRAARTYAEKTGEQ